MSTKTVRLPKILTSGVIYKTAEENNRRTALYYFATQGHVVLPGAAFFNAPASLIDQLKTRCQGGSYIDYPEAIKAYTVPIPSVRVKLRQPEWTFLFLDKSDTLYKKDTKTSIANLNDRYASTYNGSYIQSVFKWYPGSTYYVTKVRGKPCSTLTVYNNDQIQAIILPINRK